MEGTNHVDLQRLLKVCRWVVERGNHRALHARVIPAEVDAAKRGDAGLHRRLDARSVAHVAGGRHTFGLGVSRANSGKRLAERRGAQVEGDDVRAVRGKVNGALAPQLASGASDEDGLALEPLLQAADRRLRLGVRHEKHISHAPARSLRVPVAPLGEGGGGRPREGEPGGRRSGCDSAKQHTHVTRRRERFSVLTAH